MLHSYNEIKDVVQSLMGQACSSAAQGGTRLRARVWRRSLRFGLRQLTRVWLLNGCVSVSFSLSSRLSAGKCAELEGKRITEMYEKFGLELDD